MTEPDIGLRACPRCGRKLAHVDARGMVVETCTACEGLWLDAGELHRLIGMIPAFAPGSGRASGISCTGCGAELREHTLPHTTVQIDRCDRCQGVWLDKRELDDLKQQLAKIVPPDDPTWQARAQASIDFAERDAAERSRCRDQACGGRLAAVRQGRVIVDACTTCGGAWFDAGELNTVLGVSRTLSLKGAAPTALRCVRCPSEGLVATVYPKTEIPLAVCPSCRGSWVGSGDLDRIADATGVAPS